MSALFHFRKVSSNRTLALVQTMTYAAFAVSVGAQAASVQPSPQSSALARLHINVSVVAVVHAPVRVASVPSTDSITYRLDAAPLTQTYEFHNLPPEQQNPRAKRATVLKTLVIVAR